MSPRTPDRTPGPAEEEELQLEDRTADGNPTVNGAIRYVGDDVVAKLSTGVVSLSAAAGGGLNAATHRVLDQLVHEVAEDSFTEIVRTGNQVDAVRTWTDSGKTTKIREEEYTYTSGKVTTIVTKQYDGAGVLAETFTETIAYTGALVDDITGVLT